jgi:uncharacterized Zn-binding protein involved in type VI secretion
VRAGIRFNHKRVHRLYRQEGMVAPPQNISRSAFLTRREDSLGERQLDLANHYAEGVRLQIMPPAARLGDMHVCPIVPHDGGPVLPPCEPTVLIGFQPAARVTDLARCVGPPDVIAMGSPTVLIGNLMAARIGDPMVHGGVIVMGCPTVIIGQVGMERVVGPFAPQILGLKAAAKNGAALCEH